MGAQHPMHHLRIELETEDVDWVGAEEIDALTGEQLVPVLLEPNGCREVPRLPENAGHLAVRPDGGTWALSAHSADDAAHHRVKAVPVRLPVQEQALEGRRRVEHLQARVVQRGSDIDAVAPELVKEALIVRAWR